jgi:hypothetical protein
MSTLEYTPSLPPPRPFKPGDVVDVMNRDHKVVGMQVIASIDEGRGLIETRDGRQWMPDGRWSDGLVGYDFPWIRFIEKVSD